MKNTMAYQSNKLKMVVFFYHEMMKCFRATTAFENDQKKYIFQLTKKNIALFQ